MSRHSLPRGGVRQLVLWRGGVSALLHRDETPPSTLPGEGIALFLRFYLHHVTHRLLFFGVDWLRLLLTRL
jgi:hypothetical protein